MSDRLCNYCVHKARKKQWAKRGIKVRLIKDPLGAFSRGIRVVDAKSGEGLGAWYAHLPKRCCC